MRWRTALASVALCTSAAFADEPPGVPVFPPEVAAGAYSIETDESVMRRFQSEPLWGDHALGRYSERYRFTYFGILQTSLQIKIDIVSDNSGVLTATVRRSGSIVERQRKHLWSREIAELRHLAASSGIWQRFPEFWVFTDPESFCIDGMEAIVEKRDAEGYRYSRANTSCTSPTGMNRLLDGMVRIAELETGVRWFEWSE